VDYLEFADIVLARIAQTPLGQRPWLTVDQLTQEMGLPHRDLGLYDVVEDLATIDVFDLDTTVIKPNNNTDRVCHGGATLRGAWPQFFERFLTPRQEEFLAKLTELSHQPGETSADMVMVDASDVYEGLGWPSMQDPDAYRLCDALDAAGFIKQWKAMGYSITLRPRYSGFVRATQKVASEWQEKLATLLAEGETTTIDMKRELLLNSERQKGEFARDVLGLATTKASGRERYLVIGYDNDTLGFVQSVEPTVTRERLEQTLNAYTDPKPEIEWVTVPVSGGTAGVVVVKRDTTKIPYRLCRDIWKLKAGAVYVRHGTHTEAPTDAELAALEAEGSRART
jgi:hypothetical protein